MTVRILVVDDHPVVRHGLRTLLGGHPEWEIVAEAADGLEAVAQADRLRPDVIVLDITMPKMSGQELLTALKARPDTEAIPVIVLAGRKGTEPLDIESKYVIHKDIDIVSQLSRTVEAILPGSLSQQVP